jgi:hypothetical protein
MESVMKKLIFVLVILFPALCFAEPTSSINYLMNEPLSLFDAGMIQLRSYLHDHYDRIQDGRRLVKGEYLDIITASIIDPGIFYDWDENRIKISTCFIFGKAQFTEQRLKDFMTFMINDLKSTFMIDPKSGKQLYPSFATFFQHAGYQKKNEPNNISDELCNITQLEIFTFLEDGTKFTARSKLRGTEIMFSKEPQESKSK